MRTFRVQSEVIRSEIAAWAVQGFGIDDIAVHMKQKGWEVPPREVIRDVVWNVGAVRHEHNRESKGNGTGNAGS
jgi:hypothetical protein